MSFYLSKLTPNLRSSKVRRDLKNPYDLHRTLSRATPDHDQERLLWRIDMGDVPTIIVQAQLPPDWSFLQEPVPPSYLACPPASKQVELDFATGQTLRFRLRANPTVKRTLDNKKKRLALYEVDDQLAWLQRKAEQGGFKLLSALPSRQETLEFDKKGRTITLLAVVFDGRLRVRDPELFLNTVSGGIGSAKGFGMGLLSLAPDA